MAKSINYIKQFVNMKSNFETTIFLYNEYDKVLEAYLDKQYADDTEAKKISILEYKLKHFNKLLYASIYNDFKNISKLFDEKGGKYIEKRGYITIYKELLNVMSKKITFKDAKISFYEFLCRNRDKLNHANGSSDERVYIDYYNSIISYGLFDYVSQAMHLLKKIIDKISKEIGERKLESIYNGDIVIKIIDDNYFGTYNKLIKSILKNLKQTKINLVDYNKIYIEINKIKNKNFFKKILDKDTNSISVLEQTIDCLEFYIKKYYLFQKVKQKNVSSEKYLVDIILNNNDAVIYDMLVQLSEIIQKLKKDVTTYDNDILKNLSIKEKISSETMIRV